MKEQLRNTILLQRNSLSADNKTDLDRSVHKNLHDVIPALHLNNIFIYLSCKNEVDTLELIKAWLPSKNIFVPYIIDKEQARMLPSRLTSLGDIVIQHYGIPAPRILSEVDTDQMEAAIVPGIAFDRQGHRIGFGKGYYDRALEGFKGIKIGLAYDFQIVAAVPFSRHDIPMDYIITDKEVINIEANNSAQ